MYLFLLFLILGFFFNLASAFTAAFSRRFGDRCGSLLTVLLRNVLGIPVWTIGFILAARMHTPRLVAATAVIIIMGWFCLAAGSAVIVVALIAIRTKAARPSMQDVLVHSGLYAYIRHPIYSGVLLIFAGTFLIEASLPMAIACILGTIWILLQSQLEEIDLLQRIPGYRDYMKTVPRFLPRAGKK